MQISVWNIGVIGLCQRVLLRRNANVYHVPNHSPAPSVTEQAQPNDAARAEYLRAMFADTSLGGASHTSDPVGGNIFACQLTVKPSSLTEQLGIVINSSTTLTGNAGTVTEYWVEHIDLEGSETLTVHTRAVPVYTHIPGDFSLVNLNVRSDGKPP